MKGSPVRVRASASPSQRQTPAHTGFSFSGPVPQWTRMDTYGRLWTENAATHSGCVDLLSPSCRPYGRTFVRGRLPAGPPPGATWSIARSSEESTPSRVAGSLAVDLNDVATAAGIEDHAQDRLLGLALDLDGERLRERALGRLAVAEASEMADVQVHGTSLLGRGHVVPPHREHARTRLPGTSGS